MTVSEQRDTASRRAREAVSVGDYGANIEAEFVETSLDDFLCRLFCAEDARGRDEFAKKLQRAWPCPTDGALDCSELVNHRSSL